jgi:hypothetical protein
MHSHYLSPPRVLLALLLTPLGVGGLALAQTTTDVPRIAPEVSALYTLVLNGDFEQGADLPEWWAPFPPQPEVWGRHRLDREVFHSGKASGALLSDAVHPAGKATVQWMKYTVPVEGGSSLIFSYWTRIERTRPIGTGCHFYRADKGHVGFVPVPVPSTAPDWTYVRQIVRVPPEAVNMGIALYGGDEGTTWYDDVALLGTPSMTARPGTPAVDGDLRDECWGAGNSVAVSVIEPGTGVSAPRQRAWVAYDNDCLYVAFRCADAGPLSEVRGLGPGNSTVAGDYVEVLLDPTHRHQETLSLQLNAAGTLLATRGKGQPWQACARGAVRIVGNAWTAELAIPLASLGIDLAVGTTWGINLGVHHAARDEYVTWSLGAVEDAGRLGNVSLAPDLTAYYRPGLTRRLEDFAQARARLLSELQQIPVPASHAQRVDSPIAQASSKAEALRIAQGPVDRAGALSQLAELDGLLAQAREAALDGLFSLEPAAAVGDFRVVVASALQKIPQTEAVRGELPQQKVELAAAGDETESFQLVLIPGASDLKGLQVEAPPLKGPGGEVPLTWHQVGYVETAKPDYAADFVGWWPDPLLPPGPVDLSAGQRQPLWFSVQVPPAAAPGLYVGAVTVRGAGHVVSVPVQLRVRAFTLPRPGTLATAFGLYASSLSKWWWDKAPYRDNMPIGMFREWCEFLGKYRLGVKNIGAEYVTQTEENGNLRVDLGNLQQTVAPLAPRYFAPWSMSVCRVASAVTLPKISPETGPAQHARTVAAYAKEWERQGLPREVHVYGYDEPNPSHYPFLVDAYRRIREAAPGYPIMQTIGDPNPRALAGLVDIWCPLTPALTSDFYRERLAAGDRLWGYTCCSPKPPYANFFIDQPALDHRLLFWQLRQAGATGFLYWCVCYWDGLPNAASGQPCFPDVPIHLRDLGTYNSYKDNGDGFLVYPGRDRKPWPSIRLESIRDGIEDYEYLALLSRLVESARRLPARQRPPQELLTRADELCRVPTTLSASMTQYTKSPSLVLERREQVATMIEALMARGLK